MGYWGHLVLVRSDAKPFAFGPDPDPVADLGQGWRVYRVDGESDDLPGAVRVLAQRIGAPALAAYILDSDCAALSAATPAGEAWSTMLNPDLVAEEYGASRPDPDADLRAALRWAAAAGLTADEQVVRDALAGSATFVEDLFFDLLAGLGLPRG
jgi:hypothetical protein